MRITVFSFSREKKKECIFSSFHTLSLVKKCQYLWDIKRFPFK